MLRLENLHVNFGKLEVLRGVSFDVGLKDFVAIIGANGAGKSTTLRAVAGLIEPSGGAIYLDGQNISRFSTRQRLGKGIAYVPQGNKVFPSLTVRENLELVSSDYAGAISLFPNIRDKLDLKADSLSGGEQQMLSIARTLLLKPRVLMLDEPSMGLSPIFVNVVFDALKEINRNGVGILVVEQNVKKALQYAKHAFLLEQGIVKRKVTKGDLHDPEFGKAYLGL